MCRSVPSSGQHFGKRSAARRSARWIWNILVWVYMFLLILEGSWKRGARCNGGLEEYISNIRLNLDKGFWDGNVM